MKPILLLLALSTATQAQEWRPPSETLYTSAREHRAVLTQLGLTKGDWIIVVVRTGCGDCEQRSVADTPRTVVLVDGDAEDWRRRHNLRRARVVASTDWQRSQLGVLWLPTFIRVQSGRITGAQRTAP